MRAPQCPAAQAAQGELAEKFFQILQHRAHAARRLCQQRGEELQVSAEQRFIAEAVGRRGCGAEHQFDHGTRGLGGQRQCGLHQVRRGIFADLLGHQRRMVDPGGNQFISLAQTLQCGGAFQVIVQAACTEYFGCIRPGCAQVFLQLRRERVEQFLIVFEIDRHNLALKQGGLAA